ncbi:40S ribosomal protein S21 (nucleomorph) [Guillardia theta]|uniref:40S ribosomal protein S21 n=1 Tax=Guillardia theta TaxID=55529 RepID=Q98SD3_GUITH|nr:40S ribosomal protein S21 [Guillardia theta]AAK39651.1 40S ribosomal protein S21 [Guillardia theta]|mmetsp:Transcript_18314/g.60161  ORF Transcript_18314/g.60161 Transcript_18314/m.60161 type:complete len:83 (-) Transcript_18314:1015-1263(-)
MNSTNKKIVGEYIPRKCSLSNKLINNKDHASIQISIGVLDKNDLFKGEYDIFAFSGLMRKKGKSDYAIVNLIEKLDNCNLKI